MNTHINTYMHVNMCCVCVFCCFQQGPLQHIKHIVHKKKGTPFQVSTLSKEPYPSLANTSQYQCSGLDFSYYSCLELGIKNDSDRHIESEIQLNQSLLNQRLWTGPSNLCLTSPPNDSDICSSLRTTVLYHILLPITPTRDKQLEKTPFSFSFSSPSSCFSSSLYFSTKIIYHDMLKTYEGIHAL